MPKSHPYQMVVTWSGVREGTTESYTAYSREFTVSCERKSDLIGSADKMFRGDPTLYNPEEFLISALSSCHLLSYLHLCTEKGIHVLSYVDNVSGNLELNGDKGGHFTEVVLRPRVTIHDPSLIEVARQLHETAHEKCFIANSVNFTVNCIAEVKAS